MPRLVETTERRTIVVPPSRAWATTVTWLVPMCSGTEVLKEPSGPRSSGGRAPSALTYAAVPSVLPVTVDGRGSRAQAPARGWSA